MTYVTPDGERGVPQRTRPEDRQMALTNLLNPQSTFALPVQQTARTLPVNPVVPLVHPSQPMSNPAPEVLCDPMGRTPRSAFPYPPSFNNRGELRLQDFDDADLARALMDPIFDTDPPGHPYMDSRYLF